MEAFIFNPIPVILEPELFDNGFGQINFNAYTGEATALHA